MSASDRICVYVSSAYSDMRAERESLRTRVFPQLLNRCADLGVEIVGVDLVRQLASPGQAATPEWLSNALAEIDSCYPFFLGLLGEEDEAPLAEIPGQIAADYPPLVPFTHRSRRGLEIAHLLSRPQPRSDDYVQFYRRRLSATRSAESSDVFNRDSAHQVLQIETDIRAAGVSIRDYECTWDVRSSSAGNLEQFESMVLDDLEKSIRRHCGTTQSDSTTVVMPSLPASRPPTISVGAEPLPEELNDIEPSSGDAAAAPKVYDENVQFTVYRPQVIEPAHWYTLLAFAHLSEKPLDAGDSAPDPVEEVERQARQVLAEEFEGYRDVSEDSAQSVPREGELTFVPRAEGVEFNPKSRSFLWIESVHREEFRLRAGAETAGRTVRGALTVYLGSLLLAEVSISLRVASQPGDVRSVTLKTERAAAYRKLFPSYSHKDEAIVVQIERYASAVGDEYLRDATTLRAGEVWGEQLRELIRRADVFQLFWSANSMRSPYVRQEWEYALELGRSNFIRPTYWETPLPSAPDLDLPPEGLRRLHFHRLVTAAVSEVRNPDAEQTRSTAAPSPPPPLPRSTGAEPTRLPNTSRAPDDEQSKGIGPRSHSPKAATEPPKNRSTRRWASRTLSMAASVLLVAGLAGLLLNESLRTIGMQNEGPVASPAAAPPPPPPPPPPMKKRIVLRGVFFESGSARIQGISVPRIADSTEVLKESPDLDVVIAGHADAREGSDEVTRALALRRAEAVRDYLVAHGISPSRLSIEGFGESQPVASNSTAEGRAQNRRVEFDLQ